MAHQSHIVPVYLNLSVRQLFSPEKASHSRVHSQQIGFQFCQLTQGVAFWLLIIVWRMSENKKVVIGIGIIFAWNAGLQVVIIVTVDFSKRNFQLSRLEVDFQPTIFIYFDSWYQNFQRSANIILNSFIYKMNWTKKKFQYFFHEKMPLMSSNC